MYVCYHVCWKNDDTSQTSPHQDEVYDAVCSPLVAGALDGFAGAVFAYGATGAGKTHTMTGMMSRALNHLFNSLAGRESRDSYEVGGC